MSVLSFFVSEHTSVEYFVIFDALSHYLQHHLYHLDMQNLIHTFIVLYESNKSIRFQQRQIFFSVQHIIKDNKEISCM